MSVTLPTLYLVNIDDAERANRVAHAMYPLIARVIDDSVRACRYDSLSQRELRTASKIYTQPTPRAAWETLRKGYYHLFTQAFVKDHTTDFRRVGDVLTEMASLTGLPALHTAFDALTTVQCERGLLEEDNGLGRKIHKTMDMLLQRDLEVVRFVEQSIRYYQTCANFELRNLHAGRGDAEIVDLVDRVLAIVVALSLTVREARAKEWPALSAPSPPAPLAPLHTWRAPEPPEAAEPASPVAAAEPESPPLSPVVRAAPEPVAAAPPGFTARDRLSVTDFMAQLERGQPHVRFALWVAQTPQQCAEARTLRDWHDTFIYVGRCAAASNNLILKSAAEIACDMPNVMGLYHALTLVLLCVTPDTYDSDGLYRMLCESRRYFGRLRDECLTGDEGYAATA